MDIDVTKRQIERQIELLTEKLVKLESQPQDDFDDHAVLFFTKRFSGDSTVYTYVAVKIGRMWYITGTENRVQHTWESLLVFVDGGELWHAIEWEQVQ